MGNTIKFVQDLDDRHKGKDPIPAFIGTVEDVKTITEAFRGIARIRANEDALAKLAQSRAKLTPSRSDLTPSTFDRPRPDLTPSNNDTLATLALARYRAMLDQPRATSSQPRSELNQSTFNRPQTKYFGIPGPSDGYYSANRTDSRYPQTSEKRSVQPGDGQSKPEVNRLSQSYEQRVFALDEIMTRKSNEEQQTRTRNYEAILRAHENSIQQISSAKFKQDISINSNVQIIGHEFDKELARREYFHKIYTKALDDTKKYVATHINREAARRGVFNHETSIIQQNMKKRDATIDTTIGQWHEAGGAVGGTPISHNFDQRYRPNEMTRQAYNMSMNDLPTRLSNLQVMIQRLENEKQTRNEFNHNIRQFEHKAYSEVTNMMKSEQQRKQSFDQNILSIHQRQEDSRKMVTMYQRERAEVSERTNALLKQEQVRKQIFDNQFNRKYTEQLNIIKAEIEAQKIHAADQHLAELTQHYRDEAAKIAAQIKQSFGM